MSTHDIGVDRTRNESICGTLDVKTGKSCYLYTEHYGKHKDQPGGREW